MDEDTVHLASCLQADEHVKIGQLSHGLLALLHAGMYLSENSLPKLGLVLFPGGHRIRQLRPAAAEHAADRQSSIGSTMLSLTVFTHGI